MVIKITTVTPCALAFSIYSPTPFLLLCDISSVTKRMHPFSISLSAALELGLLRRDTPSLVKQLTVLAKHAGRQQSICVQVQAYPSQKDCGNKSECIPGERSGAFEHEIPLRQAPQGQRE